MSETRLPQDLTVIAALQQEDKPIDESDIVAVAQHMRWIMDIFISKGFIQREAFDAAKAILLE